MKKQKLVVIHSGGGRHLHFWRSPHSIESFQSYLDSGAIATHIQDNPEIGESVVLFEWDDLDKPDYENE